MKLMFVGKDGSMGLRTGQVYDVVFGSAYLGEHITITFDAGNGKRVCPYSSLVTFRKNWQPVEETKGCKYCNNATVDPQLNCENDLSYCGIGSSIPGDGAFIRSGGGRKTAIIFDRWDEKGKINHTVGVYIPKFCPECGRWLLENCIFKGEKNEEV